MSATEEVKVDRTEGNLEYRMDVKDEYYSDAALLTIGRSTVNLFLGRIRFSGEPTRQVPAASMERLILLNRESTKELHAALGAALEALEQLDAQKAAAMKAKE